MVNRLGYYNIGKDYRPGFIHLNGHSGLGGLYDDINEVQNGLSVANARVGAIGKSRWNDYKAKIDADADWKYGAQQKGIDPFWDYDSVVGSVVNALNKSVVTQSVTPSDDDIQFGRDVIAATNAMVDFLIYLDGSLAAPVKASADDMAARMANIKLEDPEKVGWDTFQKALKEKMDAAIPAVGIGIGVILAAGAGLLLLSSKFKSNPVGAAGLLPLLVGGGALAAVMLSKKSGGELAPKSPQAVLDKEIKANIGIAKNPVVEAQFVDGLKKSGIPYILNPSVPYQPAGSPVPIAMLSYILVPQSVATELKKILEDANAAA